MASSPFLELLSLIVRMIIMISFGIFIGTLIESFKLEKKLSFLIKPIVKYTPFSTLGATSFVTSFLSPRAANIMISSAHEEGRISEKEMILIALTNSLGALFAHLKVTTFIIIPLLGIVGVAYISVQLLGAILTTCIALVVLGFIKRERVEGVETLAVNTTIKRVSFKKLLIDRNKKILLRVLRVSVPLYTIIFFVNYYGFFDSLATHLPLAASTILPPESIAIIAVHFTGVMQSASTASLAINSGSISEIQVFITLLIGYILSTPLRAVRHTLPSALGIFPKKSGLYIVIAIQSIKILVALVVITLTLIIGDI